VRLLAATGNSQLKFLEVLTRESLDWGRVELFHLDEYVGLPETHPASFAHYIKTRIIDPTGTRTYHLLRGDDNPERVAAEMSEAITVATIDLAFAGIGENGHLAFNDPPADFATRQPYIVVDLDERCRQQQVGEGWFPSLSDVPSRAISISIAQLLSSEEIICVVPDRRKAEAVAACLEGPITPFWPASILRSHPNTTVYLDRESASLLESHGSNR
jgi:glucosamine-6-phosphate deaminase